MRPPDAAPHRRAAITDLTDDQLEALVTGLGGKPFQARQLAHWIYQHGAASYDDCKNVPRALRDRLAERAALRHGAIARSEPSRDRTTKHLIRFADGEAIECVMIPEGPRHTLCISTQVGCPVACVFCASGLDGVRRNLTTGEIVEQVLLARAQLGPGEKITNLVVMGMGEPLLNLPNLLPALGRLHDPDGVGLGARRITVSTSGIPGRIAEFAKTDHPYQLAVSLHAGDDRLRVKLVPTAKARVQEIVSAARRYGSRIHREVTFEVVLLDGVNDRRQDAQALITQLAGVKCIVNLIPWNPVPQIAELRRPSAERVDVFAAWLRRGGLKVTVRRQRGDEQQAACGQLRLRSIEG